MQIGHAKNATRNEMITERMFQGRDADDARNDSGWDDEDIGLRVDCTMARSLMIFQRDSGQQTRAQLPTSKVFDLWHNDPVAKSVVAVAAPQ